MSSAGGRLRGGGLATEGEAAPFFLASLLSRPTPSSSSRVSEPSGEANERGSSPCSIKGSVKGSDGVGVILSVSWVSPFSVLHVTVFLLYVFGQFHVSPRCRQINIGFMSAAAMLYLIMPPRFKLCDTPICRSHVNCGSFG